MKICGIYKITNLINNKIYIGSSKDIESRFYYHKCKLKHSGHVNKHLLSAWNKYGEENFKFEILKEISLSLLRKAEQFYINKYQSLNPKYGYNKTIVVSNLWDDLEKVNVINKNYIYFGCYNKEGKLFKVFRNINEIDSFFGKRIKRVYDSCNSNLTKSANGYYWIRFNVEFEKFPKTIILSGRKGRHRKILQYDLKGNFIKEWNSAVEASKTLELSSFNITRCLKLNNKYKNFKWFYSAPLCSNVH
jgi:group I intron endonuclease